MIGYKDKIDSHDQPIVKVKNSSLDNVYSYNYLGVIIDDMLSFDKFVEDKYNKANFRIYQPLHCHEPRSRHNGKLP